MKRSSSNETAFRHLDLPAGIAERRVEISAREAGTLHMLRFWASMVPHVGINEAPGHFLASFEALASVDDVVRADRRDPTRVAP